MDRVHLMQVLGAGPEEKLVTDRQTVGDIVHLVTDKHKRCTQDYDKLLKFFQGGGPADVGKKVFNFCSKNFWYYEEPEEYQYVSSPYTMLKRGYCDCKGYALFIGGILDAMKRKGYPVDWCFRFVSYSFFRKTPGHVFIVLKDSGREIWIDPVFKNFNEGRPYMYYLDKKVRTTSMNCCGAIGATAVETGQLISKTAPALAAIPVAGIFIAAAGELVGLALMLFGNGYHTQDTVRGLTQLYQYYVLGQNVTTRTVNEGLTNDSFAWFYAVLGVPIGDRRRFDALKGTIMYTTTSTGQTHEQRAQQYLTYPEVQKAGVTYEAALAATYITDQMPYNGKLAAWAAMPVNPAVADKVNAQYQAGQIAQPGQPMQPGQVPVSQATGLFGNIPVPLLIGGGVVAILLLSNAKK